jgi:hypothetical protein
MRKSRVASILLSGVASLVVQPADAGGRMSQRSACSVLKATVARRESLPITGPTGLGWYCDFAKGSNKGSYVIALRSGRKCAGICSNLMGWYAINRGTGKVREWNIEGNRVGAAL